MCLDIENKRHGNDVLSKFFGFNPSKNNAGNLTIYTKALNSLVSFLQSSDSSLLPDIDNAICDWTVHLCIGGMTRSSALSYINAIDSIYKKALADSLVPATDVFKRVKSQLKGNPELWNTWISDQSFKRLRNLTRSASSLTDDTDRKLLLYVLLKGCISLSVASLVKIDEMSEQEFEILGIDKATFTGNRKYVFPLGQSKLTSSQLAKSVGGSISRLLDGKNIGHTTSVDATLRSYWAYAAIQIGIEPHVIRSFFKNVPSGIPILSICQGDELTEDKRIELTQNVAKMFTLNEPQWYVMRLRPRVRFDEIEEKLKSLKEELAAPELFYPCEEISRRTGKKNATLQKPVIPDVVFFKSRETDIYPLFLKIGDMAWCYRINGKEGSAYAPVPRREFEAFQETICQFTSDYEVAPLGELTPAVGDTIEIIGGLFRNQEGRIEQIKEKMGDANKIYRVVITPKGGNNILWEIGIDARIARRKR